jgi:hypothetical protein
MPDHDFAEEDAPTDVVVFNDDGLAVTILDATAYAVLSLGLISGNLSRWDVKLGGGVAYFSQVEEITTGHADALITWTMRPTIAVTAGVKFSQRRFSGDESKEDPSYWTTQAYIEWRPDWGLLSAPTLTARLT